MLMMDYYKIKDFLLNEDGTALFQVVLLSDCEVYEGHFPGEPVSPGVCNIQMIMECAEQIVGKPLLLRNLLQCRFTTLVTPFKQPQVEVTIHLEEMDDVYKLKATLGKGEKIYLELKAELTENTYKN